MTTLCDCRGCIAKRGLSAQHVIIDTPARTQGQTAFTFKVPLAPPSTPGASSEETRLDLAFSTFHAANPHVYVKLVQLARDLCRRGHRLLGIKMLFEVLRWQHYMETVDPSGFKLNNNLTSRYARLIMKSEADLFEIFEVRELADDRRTPHVRAV